MSATVAPTPAVDRRPDADPRPCTLVLFGATGDLAQRKLVPALYNLLREGLLPPGFRLIGNSRRQIGDDEFRGLAADWVRRYSRRPPQPEVLDELLSRFHFASGPSDDGALYATLATRLAELERSAGGGDRLFYLSTAPELFSPIVERLGSRARQRPGAGGTRVLIEKPFGRSAPEAAAFNATVLAEFAEPEIFRIDHYLGKEQVQNILALRFANSIFEPFWNAASIASVQITAAEELGVGGRASYYEGSGALRDHLQNHLLQLLCMVAMEPPADLSAAAVRDQKVAVLGAVAPPRPADVVRARYGPGEIAGAAVPGYLEEEGVPPDSATETYVAVRLAVATERWSGVPFYLRTGKRLARKRTEITISLRPSPHPAFLAAGDEPSSFPNQLSIGLEPDGAVQITLASKLPGLGMRVRPATITLPSHDDGGGAADAYERLLLDALRGDPALFTRSDEIEGQWRICDPLLAGFAAGQVPMSSYPAGSQGPAEAEALLAPGDSWRGI